jgi:hypothetical protein
MGAKSKVQCQKAKVEEQAWWREVNGNAVDSKANRATAANSPLLTFAI